MINGIGEYFVDNETGWRYILRIEKRRGRAPVRVVRASGEFDGNNFQASQTTPDLASFFVNGTDIQLDGVTHFIPMEAPELIVDYIRLTTPS